MFILFIEIQLHLCVVTVLNHREYNMQFRIRFSVYCLNSREGGNICNPSLTYMKTLFCPCLKKYQNSLLKENATLSVLAQPNNQQPWESFSSQPVTPYGMNIFLCLAPDAQIDQAMTFALCVCESVQ